MKPREGEYRVARNDYDLSYNNKVTYGFEKFKKGNWRFIAGSFDYEEALEMIKKGEVKSYETTMKVGLWVFVVISLLSIVWLIING